MTKTPPPASRSLTKSPSFQAMRKFALAVEQEPIHEVRAALRWMTDFFAQFEQAHRRKWATTAMHAQQSAKAADEVPTPSNNGVRNE